MSRKIKILLVEDNEVDRQKVRRSLKTSGLDFDLTEANDGADAIRTCFNEQFDCVFLDYRLPDIDGEAVFKAITAHRDIAPAVIFLTGLADNNLAVQVMEAGVVDYLTKDEISAPVLKRAVQFAAARRSFLRRLSEMAQIDSLTGLPNRAAFQPTVNRAVAQAKRSGTLAALMLLDLDHFKGINDTMGHPAGDDVLKKTAARLSCAVRATDTVVRLGGDEFVVVAVNLDDAQGAAVVAQKLLDTMSARFQVMGRDLFVFTSIGVVLAPIDGNDSAELLKFADLALYKAKANGRAQYHFYDEKLNSAAQGQHDLEVKLREALPNNEFVLHYQPKMSIDTGEVLGTECLIRWNQPELGMIQPLEFIPVAEKCHLIAEIGDWVLQEACRQNVAWQKAGLPALNCSINLSAIQVRNARLIQSIDDAVEASGFDPAYLEIEITESAIMENVDYIAALLGAIRLRGISVSIDDFGTGYSSLVHLKQLPVDKLKIDESFISNVTKNNDDAEITSAIISLGQKLGLQIVAEGVEEKSQLDFLRKEGCDQAQGFYFAPPLSPEEFFEWFRLRQSGSAVANR